MWDLPGPGIELVSSALASGFLTTGQPETPGNILKEELPGFAEGWDVGVRMA